jgi:hypothetical protein
VLVDVVLVHQAAHLVMFLELLELQILVEAAELVPQLLELVVLVSSSSAIKLEISQLKLLVEQFLMLVVRLFILLLHQRPLPSLILL